jgi:hypothetical protein
MRPIDPRLIAVFVWILGCSLVTLRFLLHRPLSLPKYGYALLAAFFVRLVPALVLPRGARYEMGVFRQVAETTLNGQSVYLSTVPHPHLPLQLYWFATALWLNIHVGLEFVFWLKLPNILAEVAMTGLVYSAIRRTGVEKEALFGAWLYAFNPVTTLVAAYQGQFDTTPLFLMVAACYLFEFHQNKRWGLVFSSFVLGLGILSKTWPVMLLPIILLRLSNWRSRLGYTAISAAVPIIGIFFYELLFPGSLLSILRRSANAGAIPGWWGYSSILNVWVELTGKGSEIYAALMKVAKFAALLCGIFTILGTRCRSLFYSLLLTILVLFAAVPNLGLQGLSWVIPLAIILKSRSEVGWYIIGATVHMIVSYWGIHLTDGLYVLMPPLAANIIIQLSSLAAWGVIVLWCAQELFSIELLPSIFEHKRTGTSTSEILIGSS